MVAPINRNLATRVRNTVYTLKRDFGARLDVYKNLGTTTDPKTGIRAVNKDVTVIQRAVILPIKMGRDDPRLTAITIDEKLPTRGVPYDSGTRDFLVDWKDAPNLTLTESDWLVFNGTKYQIKTFQLIEYSGLWYITAKQLIGEPFEQIYVLTATSLLDIEHTATP